MGKLDVGGLCLIAIAVIGFFVLASMNIDCDQFSCIGYLIILGPIFLFGLALMIIAAIVATGTYVYSLLKKEDDK